MVIEFITSYIFSNNDHLNPDFVCGCVNLHDRMKQDLMSDWLKATHRRLNAPIIAKLQRTAWIHYAVIEKDHVY